MSMRGEPGYGDDDRLPWLETVDDDYHEGPSIWRTVLLVILLLGVVAAASLAYYWYQQQRSFTGTGDLIEAEDGDYKVKVENSTAGPAGGEGDSVYPTSEGATTNATIDTSRTAEDPIEGKAAPATQAPTIEGSRQVTAAVPATGGKLVIAPPKLTATPSAKPAAAVAPKPVTPVPTPRPTASPSAEKSPTPTGAGAVIQLGSFPSEASAQSNWTRLSKRFSYLAPLGHVVERAEVNDKTVYRLRVTAGTADLAKDLCGRLKVAGENCFLAR